MTHRLLFDVSGLVQWYAYLANPSGVQRFVEKVLQSAPIAADSRVEFVARGLGSDCFYRVNSTIIADLADQGRRLLAISRVRGLFADSMRLARPGMLWTDLRAIHLPYIALGLTRLGPLWEAWCARRAPKWPLRLRPIEPPSKDDVIVGLGDFWCHRGHVDELIRLKARSGARLVHMVHDLFAIDRPEWTHPYYGRLFGERLAALAPYVDRWLVNSRFVAASLSKYLASSHVEPPAIDVIPMGWDGFEAPDERPGALDDAIFERLGLERGAYILHVGTIEPRKNLSALIDAMLRLRRDMGATAPICLLVGRDGWKSDAVRGRLAQVGAAGGGIRWIQNVADRDLPALYRGARFTVVPSLGEGWGLPVQESLAQGTPCIASNAGALPEVGQDLATYVEPQNPDQLYRAIAHWVTDDGALAAARDRIHQRLRHPPPLPTWHRAGEEVLRSAITALSSASVRTGSAETRSQSSTTSLRQERVPRA